MADKLSPAATASLLGVSERTIRRWIVDGAPHERLSSGRILMEPEFVLAWRDKQTGKKIEEALLQAKLRKTNLDAEKAELSLDEQLGTLIRADDVQKLEYQRILKVREGLLALEFTLPPRLLGLDEAEMRVIVRRETRRLLEEYARGRGESESEDDDEPVE